MDRSLHQPANGSSLVAQRDGPWGTLGCLVRRHGRLFILGSGHVMTGGGAAVGGDPVLQPPDIFLDARTIAHVTESVHPSTHNGPPGAPGATINTLDAALAEVDPGQVNGEIGVLRYPTGFRKTPLEPGDFVQICGAASGQSGAAVLEINHPDSLPYDDQWAEFSGLVLCDPYSDDGDSGAAVLDENFALVGIHLGVVSRDHRTLKSVFCPIQAVLDHWTDLELVTSD